MLPLFLAIGVCGDPDWIRTNNLPLRRGLLYPVEPRDHKGLNACVWKLGQRLRVGFAIFLDKADAGL
jgi:hypothetical protein